LDGRGGLEIGNDVNISNYCRCISAGHDMNSKYFAYRPGHVKIEDFCWLGTGAMVLDNSQLARGTVISAGSVFKGISETNDVYMGVPARFIKKRNLSGSYHVIWKPWFK
jgi:acetyltransferase-like isoleucine patch superfamily enzyme